MKHVMICCRDWLKNSYLSMMIAMWACIVKICIFLIEAFPDSVNELPRTSFIYRIGLKISFDLVRVSQFSLERMYLIILRREQLR